MCMVVTPQFDDNSAFALADASTSWFQVFTLAPGVTSVEQAQWMVVPLDTYGRASVAHGVSADVALDMEQSCGINSPSLLKQGSYHLTSSANNTIGSAKLSVVNATLQQQQDFVQARKTVTGSILSVLLGALGSWAVGLWSRLERRVFGAEPSGDKGNPGATRDMAPEGITQVTESSTPMPIGGHKQPGGVLNGVRALAALTAGPGLVLVFVGPPSVPIFFASIALVIIGMVLIVVAVRMTKASKTTRTLSPRAA